MFKNLKPYFKILNTKKTCIYKFSACDKTTYQGKKQKLFDKVIYEDKNVPDPKTTDFEEGEFLPRKLTYEPPLLKKYIPKNKPWLEKYKRINIEIKHEPKKPEYTKTPQYPPIIEMSKGFLRNKSNLREKRISFYKSLDEKPTFDEKQLELCQVWSMPMVYLKSWSLNYDYYPLYKHITKTNDFYDQLILPCDLNDVELNKLVEEIKPAILNSIKIHLESEFSQPFYEVKTLKVKNKYLTNIKKLNCLIENINSICLKYLSSKNNDLNDFVTDIDCDIRSWWFVNNFDNDKKYLFEKINQPFQYHDHAVLNVRSNKPLKSFLEDNDELMKKEVEQFKVHPTKLGFRKPFIFPMTSAGFLPPLEKQNFEFNDFPFITYLNREFINIRKNENMADYLDEKDFIQSMAIMHNYSYLNSVSAIHGFTPYSELTYPFTNQCIVTDGKFWSFHFYQLNTHVFHNDLPLSEKSNQCWSTPELKLFDSFENGEFQNVNNEVIKNLIKIYLQKTFLDKNVTYRPYLGLDTRSEEDKITIRQDLRRKIGQFKTRKEFCLAYGRKVYPFEEIYLRGKFRRHVHDYILFTKTKINFPKEKLQLGYQEINKK